MIQLFVVFHKQIFDECYKTIPRNILKKYFTFIAVNERIPKTFSENRYNVVREWELPVYDPTFQERGYNENSAIYHVYANRLHENYKWIGFFQYDMIFIENFIPKLLERINEKCYYALQMRDFDYCAFRTWGELKTVRFVMEDWERYSNKKFNKSGLFPLCNTFLLPTESFIKIMLWVSLLYPKLYPWCVEPPNRTHFGHIGGIYERVMGFAIRQLELPVSLLKISHREDYKKLAY